MKQQQMARLIGARIRQLRLDRGMDQIELIERAHGTTNLPRYEKRHAVPDLFTIAHLAEGLGCDPGTILCVLDERWRMSAGWDVEAVEAHNERRVLERLQLVAWMTRMQERARRAA